MLSEQQKQAVEATEDKVLVLAGAGAGKTTVLTERINHLIQNKKVSPTEIMAFTFTRKAAGEIRSRLEVKLGKSAQSIKMGTMHGIALNLIQTFKEMLGFNGPVTVYGPWEEAFLMKETAIDLDYHTGKSWKNITKSEVDELFKNYYLTGIKPGFSVKGSDLFQAFLDRCNQNNALTYGLLLIELKTLVPRIMKLMNIKHVIVDEVQDLDLFQWQIVNNMCTHAEADLFVVGDIDQSIFEFRGAYPGYLVRHQSQFTIYRLESNYRSLPPIVNAANNLIEYNENRLPKVMVPFKNDDPYHNINVLTHDDVTSDSIGEFVRYILQDRMLDCKDIAIIARNHIFLEKTAKQLTKKGFNTAYIGKETALSNSETFRRVHAFLKLIVNPYDNFSFLLIRDLIGLSRDQYNDIRVKATERGMSHFQYWLYINTGSFSVFFETTTKNKCLGSTMYSIKYMATGAYPYREGWDIDIDETFHFVLNWLAKQPLTSLHSNPIQKYLDWLATYDHQDEIPDQDNENEAITLMTIHAAKGLEWPAVIVLACNEGILPSSRALKNPKELEAERRLAYVAFTRAEKYLFLTSRPVNGKLGKGPVQPVSRFRKEIFNEIPKGEINETETELLRRHTA